MTSAFANEAVNGQAVRDCCYRCIPDPRSGGLLRCATQQERSHHHDAASDSARMARASRLADTTVRIALNASVNARAGLGSAATRANIPEILSCRRGRQARISFDALAQRAT